MEVFYICRETGCGYEDVMRMPSSRRLRFMNWCVDRAKEKGDGVPIEQAAKELGEI